MVTFKVDNVNFGKFNTNLKSDENFTKIMGPGIESKSSSFEDKNTVCAPVNNFIAAINTAYDRHLPIAISPDSIWLTIAQGLSQHIEQNSEELRHQFVDFEGQKSIRIEFDFQKGNPYNDWAYSFSKFSNEIKKYIGKKRDLIVGNFSTTTPVSQAANEIVLMEAMKKFFKYEMVTCCGFPEITLLGTKEDWISIRNRIHTIDEFGLSWWTEKLKEIIANFISVYDGNVNIDFWKNMFKESGGSGGPYISGWITNLYPYLSNKLKNDFTRRGFGRLTSRDIPLGISKVPFVWNHYGKNYNMELMGGFSSFTYKNGVIQPDIGWAVRDVDSIVYFKATIMDKADNVSKHGDFHAYEKHLSIMKEYKVNIYDSYDYNYISGYCDQETYTKIVNLSGLQFEKVKSEDL